MNTPIMQNNPIKNTSIVADLLEFPDHFDNIVDDPVLFESLAKALAEEARDEAKRFLFDDFTIDLSLKDIVD